MRAEYWRWAGLYFVVPVVGVIVGRAFNSQKKESLSKLFEAETLLFSIGMVLLMLILWPLIAFGIALDPWITSVGYWLNRRRDRFKCRPEHLLGCLSIEQAEANAVVIDPRQRVPNLPFGHLNAAWQEFKQKKKFWYRLRQFSIPGTPPLKGDAQWSAQRGWKLGYAWVSLWRVKAEFLYEWD